MTTTGHAHPAKRETGLWTTVSLAALAVFFLGCGCFTMAEILLGSNDELSAVLAIVGIPLFIVGGVVLAVRSRIGEPPSAPRPRR